MAKLGHVKKVPFVITSFSFPGAPPLILVYLKSNDCKFVFEKLIGKVVNDPKLVP